MFFSSKSLILLSSHLFSITSSPLSLPCAPPPPSPSLSSTCLFKQSLCFHINFYDMCFEEGSLCAWKCFLILSWQYSQLTSTCAFLLAAPGQYIRWLWWESAGPRGSSGGCWHCLSQQKSPFQAGRDLPYHEQCPMYLHLLHRAHIPPFQPHIASPPQPDVGGGSARSYLVESVRQRYGGSTGPVSYDLASSSASSADHGSSPSSYGHGSSPFTVRSQWNDLHKRRGIGSQGAGGIRGTVQTEADKTWGDPGGRWFRSC